MHLHPRMSSGICILPCPHTSAYSHIPSYFYPLMSICICILVCPQAYASYLVPIHLHTPMYAHPPMYARIYILLCTFMYVYSHAGACLHHPPSLPRICKL
jgi:hypothetical protein